MSSPMLTIQQPLGQTRSITDAFMKARALRRERNITVTVKETEGQELLSPDLEKGKLIFVFEFCVFDFFVIEKNKRCLEIYLEFFL